MKFLLEINLDYEAFKVGFMGQEVARILRYAAARFDDGYVQGKLLDINGNIVGEYSVNKG